MAKKTQKKLQPNGRAEKTEDNLTQANIKAVAKIEEEADADRSLSQVVAGMIADFCGSMTFVWVHIVWFGVWIVANTFSKWVFDPFPFTFLTLVVSLEAIFLSTFILINQNRETEISERRNHLDLQINLLSEQENTKMLYFLDAIARKIGVDVENEDFGGGLETETDPERIMQQIRKEQEPASEKT